MKAPPILIIFLFGLVSRLSADWDYLYLTLDDLMDASSLIVVAEIKSIEEKIENEEELAMEKVSQQIVFSSITHLKGETAPAEFSYYASYIPALCAPPESYYIDSPPGTKYLLFLTKKGESYQSVLGPCGALKVSGNDLVFWYTDESKAQRYSEHWKEKLVNGSGGTNSGESRRRRQNIPKTISC